MANEYQYMATLDITHPNMDVSQITEVLSHLRPNIESTVGSDRRKANGTLLEPRRKSEASYWSASLDGGRRLDSAQCALSAFIEEHITHLEVHRVFIEELLGTGGKLALSIWWFCASNYCADILTADSLAKLAGLNIDLELNIMFEESTDRANEKTH